MLNQKTLKKHLDYDPETGIFKWKTTLNRRIRVGDVAGTLRSDGYIQIALFHKDYLAHRLAWLYVNEEFPKDHMDHINGVRIDNRIVNLRAVTYTENNRNRSLSKRNTSGVMGVSWCKRDQKWQVVIQKTFYGRFKFKSDAIAKAEEVYKELGFHENHGRACND